MLQVNSGGGDIPVPPVNVASRLVEIHFHAQKKHRDSRARYGNVSFVDPVTILMPSIHSFVRSFVERIVMMIGRNVLFLGRACYRRTVANL